SLSPDARDGRGIGRLGREGGGTQLVQRRVTQLIGPYRWRAFNHLREHLQHFGVALPLVGVRVLLGFPQADREHFWSAGIDEEHLVLETLLLAKDRDELLVQ